MWEAMKLMAGGGNGGSRYGTGTSRYFTIILMVMIVIRVMILMTTLMKMVTTMIAPSMYVIVNQCWMVSGVWKTGDDRNFQPKEPPADSLTICAVFQKRISSKKCSHFNIRCFFQARCGTRLQSRKLFGLAFQKMYTNKTPHFFLLVWT